MLANTEALKERKTHVAYIYIKFKVFKAGAFMRSVGATPP